MHRTIVVLDIAGYGVSSRSRAQLIERRDRLAQAVETAFATAGISLTECWLEDRGDGVFILAPATAPMSVFVESLPEAMVDALHVHGGSLEPGPLRLRMAVHAGEVAFDSRGVTGASINFAFRLLDSAPLKTALESSPGVLALMVSSWFYDEVVRHSARSRAASYRQVEVSVKETQAHAWISLPDHPYVPHDVRRATPDQSETVPRQLPVHTSHFVERPAVLDALAASLKEGANATVLVGESGVGKTSAMSHAAHLLAERWPDGQLYSDLRGFDPLGEPVKPTDVLPAFLHAMGVSSEQVPADPDARARLFRDVAGERRVLVVLDNVRDPEHVRSLVPATSTCQILVISRRYLSPPVIGVPLMTSVTLDVLSVEEATTFMTRFLGHERVVRESDATARIIETCGRLPLALTLFAARAALSPTVSLADLVHDLDDMVAQTGDHTGTDRARTVFLWSYRQLTDDAAGLLRMLAENPEPDIDLVEFAASGDLDARSTRAEIAQLTRARLLDEYVPGRYRFHDLLRTFTIDLKPAAGPSRAAEISSSDSG